MTLLVPPAGNFFTGERNPVKGLDEYELQHAFSIDGVSMITHRFVLWVDKKRTRSSLIIFHNSVGPDRAVVEPGPRNRWSTSGPLICFRNDKKY